MTTDYHDAWVNNTTRFRAADMTAPLSSLDSKIGDLDTRPWYINCQYLNSKPANSALLLRLNIGRELVLPSSATGSLITCGTDPASSAEFTIKKNGSTTLGTATIAAGQTSGTFSVSGDKQLYVGDILTIEAPASQDADLLNISIMLKLVKVASNSSTTTTTTTI